MRRSFRFVAIVTTLAIFCAGAKAFASSPPQSSVGAPIPLGTSWLAPTAYDAQAAGRAVARLAALRDGGPGLIAIANGATLSTLPPSDRVRLAHALAKIADQPSAARGLATIVELMRSGDETTTYASDVALIGLANANTKEGLGLLLRAARSGASARDRVTEVWSAFPPRDPTWLVDTTPVALVAAAARNGDLRALEWFATRVSRLKGEALAEGLTVMAELGDERALGAARQHLSGTPQVLAAAVLVLKTFNAKDANAQLLSLTQAVATRGVGFEIARRTRSVEILPFALQIDPTEASYALERRIAYLALIGGPLATSAIGKLLVNMSAKIADIAARTLASMHTPDSIEAIAKVATGKNLLMARGPSFFAYALHRQGGGHAHPGIEQELARLLRSQHEDERGVSVRTLGESGNALPWTKLQDDKSVFVREQLAIVLSKRGPLTILRMLAKKDAPEHLRALALSARVLRDDPTLSLRELEGGAPSSLSTYWTVRHEKLSQCTLATADIMAPGTRLATVLGCVARESAAAKWALLHHLPVEPNVHARFAMMRNLRTERENEEAVIAYAMHDPDRSIRDWARGGAAPSRDTDSGFDLIPTESSVALQLTFDGIELEPLFQYRHTPPVVHESVLSEDHEADRHAQRGAVIRRRHERTDAYRFAP